MVRSMHSLEVPKSSPTSTHVTNLRNNGDSGPHPEVVTGLAATCDIVYCTAPSLYGWSGRSPPSA